MNHIFKTIIVCLAFFCATTFAEEGEGGYWPKSYFVGAGIGIVASKGDIGDYAIKTKNKDEETEIVHLPSFDIFAWPDYFIGVDIGYFSLSANFNYWTFQEASATIDDKNDVRIWRFGLEFVYNFFWPDFFQPGVGIGYNYTSIKTFDNVHPADESKKLSDSELMGSALSLILNVRYFMTEFLVIQPSIKVSEAWFGSMNTDNGETNELKHKLWQTFATAELALIYHF